MSVQPYRVPLLSRRRARLLVSATLAVVATTGVPVAHAAFPSDTPPDLIPTLTEYDALWTPDPATPPATGTANDLHGTVDDASTLSRNDELAVFINQHATAAQRFRALQDAEYNSSATGPLYDQSYTVSDGLGSTLGPIYVQGRRSGALPLTTALINSSNGTTGA